jgi:hypothetical protein
MGGIIAQAADRHYRDLCVEFVADQKELASVSRESLTSVSPVNPRSSTSPRRHP